METIPTLNLEEVCPQHMESTIDDMVEFTALKKKAQRRAIEDKLTSYYKRAIDEGQYEVFSSSAALILQDVDRLRIMTNNIMDVKQNNNPWCFYTINFKAEYDDKFTEVYELMEKFTAKCVYLNDNCIYAIEQRQEEPSESSHGTHVHIAFPKGNNPPSKIQRAFSTKFFDKYVGSNAALDYRYVKDVTPKIEYIMGNKRKRRCQKCTTIASSKIVSRYHTTSSKEIYLTIWYNR